METVTQTQYLFRISYQIVFSINKYYKLYQNLLLKVQSLLICFLHLELAYIYDEVEPQLRKYHKLLAAYANRNQNYNFLIFVAF